MAKLAILVAILALAVVASAQYKKEEYGHGKAESYQNYHLHVGHQVPVKVPVYVHEAKYEPKYEHKYEPKHEAKYH